MILVVGNASIIYIDNKGFFLYSYILPRCCREVVKEYAFFFLENYVLVLLDIFCLSNVL